MRMCCSRSSSSSLPGIVSYEYESVELVYPCIQIIFNRPIYIVRGCSILCNFTLKPPCTDCLFRNSTLEHHFRTPSCPWPTRERWQQRRRRDRHWPPSLRLTKENSSALVVAEKEMPFVGPDVICRALSRSVAASRSNPPLAGIWSRCRQRVQPLHHRHARPVVLLPFLLTYS
jgi:hypothetical protein